MYYINTPNEIALTAIYNMAEDLKFDMGQPKASDYVGFNYNGKFLYTDNPKDFGDRSLHCNKSEFIKALRTFTPQSRRPMAPEVT